MKNGRSPVTRLSTPIFLTLACITAPACDASYPAAPTDTTPISLQLLYTLPADELTVGVIYSFHAYTVTADGGWASVTAATNWTSSNPFVLQERADVPGMYTGRGPGRVSVLARYREMTTSVDLLVTAGRGYPRLAVNLLDLLWNVGRTDRVDLRMLQDSTAPSQPIATGATWTTSQPDVATVDGPSITARSPGVTTISAEYGGMSTTFTLGVAPRTR